MLLVLGVPVHCSVLQCGRLLLHRYLLAQRLLVDMLLVRGHVEGHIYIYMRALVDGAEC